MSAIKVPNNLPHLVKTTFGKACANGDLMYFPTQVTILAPSSIPFQLRYSPSLASKPGTSEAEPGEPKKFFDPFADPPPALFLADLPPGHFLVLNKFAVVPEHFILATKAFKQQEHLLEEEDLAATHACIEAYFHASGGDGDLLAAEEKELFAFFNSGVHSGASQPHRHMQLLPVKEMREGLGRGEWSVLANRIEMEGRNLPFKTFSGGVCPGMGPEELHSLYLQLYRQACEAVASFLGDSTAEGSGEQTSGKAKISYNLAMTRSKLVVCPRLADGGPVVVERKTVGSLSLNGTVLSGSCLVKNEAEWNALRHEPNELLRILKKIGVPRDVTLGNGTIV